jgi:hypothetical protein
MIIYCVIHFNRGIRNHAGVKERSPGSIGDLMAMLPSHRTQREYDRNIEQIQGELVLS